MTATLNLPEPPITRKSAARERPWLPAALALGWVHLWFLASAGFAQTTPQSPKHKASGQPAAEPPSYFRGKVEKAEKTFREMVVKAGDELRLAVLEDPAKSTYNVDGKGNLTAGSYDLLVKQCTRCANHLNNCEAALKQISELGKNIPFLDEEAKAAQEKRVEIRAARERIQQFAKRFKLPTKKLGL